MKAVFPFPADVPNLPAGANAGFLAGGSAAFIGGIQGNSF